MVRPVQCSGAPLQREKNREGERDLVSLQKNKAKVNYQNQIGGFTKLVKEPEKGKKKRRHHPRSELLHLTISEEHLLTKQS